MPTYIYETIPESCCAEPKHYEIEQNENDAALTYHPETREAIKRVLLDGQELIKNKENSGSCACGSEDGC